MTSLRNTRKIRHSVPGCSGRIDSTSVLVRGKTHRFESMIEYVMYHGTTSSMRHQDPIARSFHLYCTLDSTLSGAQHREPPSRLDP